MTTFSKDVKISLLIFILSFGLYLSTITSNFALAHDSVSYLNIINSNVWDFHPHHLMYFPFNKLIKLFFVDLLGLNIPSYIVYSGINSFFGSLTLLIIFRNFRILQGISLQKSLSLILLIGFSFGFWFYSICIETYIIPIFFLFSVYYYLVKNKIEESNMNYYIIGLMSGLATIFHQIYVLLFPIILIYFIIEKRKYYSIFIFTLMYCLAVGVAYFSVILFVEKIYTLDEIISWLTLYNNNGNINYWVKPGIKSLFLASIGFLRTFFATHFLFAIAGVDSYLKSKFANNFLEDELFLVRNLNPTVAAIFFISYISSCLFVIKRLIFDRLKGTAFKAESFLILFTVIFTLFFLFWSPDNLEFWIPQQMIFCIYFVLKTKFTKFTYLLALTLFCVNFFGTILFAKNRTNNYYEVMYKDLDKVCKEIKQNNFKLISITEVTYVGNNYQKLFGVDSILAIGNFEITNLTTIPKNYKVILVTNRFGEKTKSLVDSFYNQLHLNKNYNVIDITNEKKYYLIENNQGMK